MPRWLDEAFATPPKRVPPAPTPRVPLKREFIYLGEYDNPEEPGVSYPLPYVGERHLLLFGPNGSGKGTRLLIPNLLALVGRSVVVIDPKGELAAITADYRRTVSDVIILNPFNVLGIEGKGFNPLASLDPGSPTFFDDAAGIGEALIRTDERDAHWSESAQGLVVALVMWEVKEARRENRAPLLENVRLLMTQANQYETDATGRHQVGGFRFMASDMIEAGGLEIASLMSRFQRDSDEIASIRSTADRQTWWMLSPLMRENLKNDDVNFRQLKEKLTTIYIILPAERMRTHSAWLRLVIISALRALYTHGGLRTLFILDEFAQLGYLPTIEDAFGLVRGYGVQLWPILQDLTQLKMLYKDRWETFMANSGVVEGFSPNDMTTADWMSRRAGETTALASGYSIGDSQNPRGQGSSHNTSYQQMQRRVFLPQELIQMKLGHGVIFSSGSATSVTFNAPPYWKLDEIKDRAKPNPYYQPGERTGDDQPK